MLWLKAFHIVAVVCWFAGLFYLPRLFVYHVQAQAEGDAAGSARFALMERKLYRGIMLPSMLAVLVLGIWMLIESPGFLQMHWMHAKLTLVVLLIGYHHMCGAHLKRLANGSNQKSERYFRLFNELPVLLLVAIVLLVVVRPF